MASGFASNMAPAFAEDSTQPVTASKCLLFPFKH